MRDAKRTRGNRLATLALALLTPVACERFDDTPRLVASDFWNALGERDLDVALALSDAASEVELRELSDGLVLEDVTLDQILRNESSALVETRGELARRDIDLTFHTHLTRIERDWRVDVDATERELRRSALAASFEDVRESISESTGLLVEEFEKRALEATESLREALEEIEESLRDGATPST